jgi:hypothetical protein
VPKKSNYQSNTSSSNWTRDNWCQKLARIWWLDVGFRLVIGFTGILKFGAKLIMALSLIHTVYNSLVCTLFSVIHWFTRLCFSTVLTRLCHVTASSKGDSSASAPTPPPGVDCLITTSHSHWLIMSRGHFTPGGLPPISSSWNVRHRKLGFQNFLYCCVRVFFAAEECLLSHSLTNVDSRSSKFWRWADMSQF